MKVLKRAVELSHEIIESVLKEGDTTVDCTCGNGNDTAFLANLVGSSGKVMGFDIQEKALSNTRKRITGLGYEERVELIHDSHENIDKYITKPIKAAMYNLGYLPGGDHSKVTRFDSTIYSLEKVLNLLEIGGVVTIAIYYGHEGGMEEKDAVIEFASKLDQNFFAVQKIEFLNYINYPPILVVIEKTSE